MARPMKDSGVPWIGQIPVDWTIQRNKACFDCSKDIVGAGSASTQLLSLTTMGIKKKRPEDSTGKVPESYDTYQVVDEDDIVMCLFDLDVSAVFSGRSPFAGMISPAYKVLKCRPDKIIPSFADYWFSFIFDGRKFKHYSKNLRYTLNYDEFAVLPIIHPSVEEQTRIADFLDAECARIDSVIEQTRASIEEYKKLKQSVITQAVTKGIRPERKMKDSGIEWIGEIPAEWECLFLKYVTSFQEGPGIMGNDFRDEGVPLIRISGVKGTVVSKEGCNYLDEAAVLQKWNHFKLHLGDVVISASASTGVAALVDDDCVGCIPYTGLIRFPITNGVNNHFLRYYLLSDEYNGQINIQKTGTAIQHYGPTHINKVKIALPEYDEQTCIAQYLDDRCTEIDFIIQYKEQLITSIETYKKSLIYEYVTGKKEVSA